MSMLPGDPYKRYHNDAHFRNLVDTIYAVIRDGTFTPEEVRQASTLAMVKCEKEQPRVSDLMVVREGESLCVPSVDSPGEMTIYESDSPIRARTIKVDP